MSDIKFTCPSMWPSGCVLFTGHLPDFIPANSFTCDGNLDELLEKYGDKIDAISTSIDLTAINKGCYSFNPLTAKVKDVVQETITKVCALQTSLTALQTSFTNLNIGNEQVQIDLGTLTPVGDPCAVAPHTYTLIAILNLFKTEIINIKSQL